MCIKKTWDPRTWAYFTLLKPGMLFDRRKLSLFRLPFLWEKQNEGWEKAWVITNVQYLNQRRHGQNLSSTPGQAELLPSDSLKLETQAVPATKRVERLWVVRKVFRSLRGWRGRLEPNKTITRTAWGSLRMYYLSMAQSHALKLLQVQIISKL